MKTDQKGFSLSELLVAMFVLVVGISGVTSALYWGTQRIDSGKYVTDATEFGRLISERIVGSGVIRSEALLSGGWPQKGVSGINDNALTSGQDPMTVCRKLFEVPISDLEFGAQTDYTGGTASQSKVDQYRRHITCDRLQPKGWVNASGSSYLADLARITVTIYWQEKGHVRNVRFETLAKHGVD